MARSSVRLKDRLALQRAEILAAGTAVFLRLGYSRASIADIVGELGKAKSWLYTYYPSKEALFLDIIECRSVEAADSYGPAPGDDVSVEDALRIVGRRYLSAILQPGSFDFHRIVVSEANHLPAIAEIFQRVRVKTIAPLAAHLQRALQNSKTTFPDYLQAGEFFYDLCASTLHRRALMGSQQVFSDEEIRANVDRAVSIFLYVCEPKTPERGGRKP